MADDPASGAPAPDTKPLASSSAKKSTTANDVTAVAIREEIAAWFVERIHDSPVSRSPTDVVNYTREAVTDLETRLIARLAR